ncbi:MAG: ArsA family ATPase [Deltaproteobacteria bacterium]|nr:ArsA family ATPase [Deltaproteobacteria bacterium]
MIVVTGKGGVGKTTVSAALALGCARRGRRTLVATVQAKDRLSPLLEVPRIGPHNTPVLPNLEAVNMTPEAAMEEYGLMMFRFRALSRLVFENRFVRAFLHAVPGIDAWALLGKATYHALETDHDRRPRYDTVILDAPATGHALSLLTLPRTLAELAPPGQLRRDGRERWELLADPERTEILPVTLLEEMPVSETGELVERLRGELGLPVRRVVINAVPERTFEAAEVEQAVIAGQAPADHPLIRAAVWDLHRRRLEDEQRRRLAALVELPTVDLPLICRGRLHRPCVERITSALEQGIPE